MTSILTTIKKMIGIDSAYTQFDTDIIILINMAIASLRQLGVGPETGFKITGITETWTDLVGNTNMLEAIQTYIYLKVKRLFDSPSSSHLSKAIDDEIKELEWRINITADIGEINQNE